MNRVLIIDDEPRVLASFAKLVRGRGYEVLTARRAEDGIEAIGKDPPDLLVMDIRLPGISGLDALREIHAIHPRLPVILMTGYGTMQTAVEATKRGAFDYLIKPFDPEQMLAVIESALSGARLMERPVDLDPAAPSEEGDALIGQSPAMQDVYKAIGRVAPTDATVLIRGETGTGKELVARAIFQHSRRHEASLVAVNCTAIPEALLESELFGHQRGAFTGAVASRIGRFEQADRGTLFLDEIGDLPPGVQAKILRVLQERSFQRVGGTDTVRVDVRLIAATNRNLEQAIAEGSFREDLYHRLHIVTIHLPPLRTRREDIPRLASYFLERISRETGIARSVLSAEALDLLRAHEWPGNVRELMHAIHRALIFTQGYPIQAADIRRALAAAPGALLDRAASHGPRPDEVLGSLVRTHLDSAEGEGTHERLLDLLDRTLVIEAMRRARGNQSRAARILGLSRSSLQARLLKYGIRSEPEIRES